MVSSKTVTWIKGFAHLWKDLALLVVGIYLALWMENTVQDWENDEKQRNYIAQLSQDLASDEKQIEGLLPRLERKIDLLEQGITYLQSTPVNPEDSGTQQQAINIASTVNNYFFFSPQDFTFLSMRESGDFKLLKDDLIKRQLLELNSRYQLIETLQGNYMQGLDDEFIPMWVRHVDMIRGEMIYPEVVKEPIFKNMLGFAWNETTQRRIHLERTLSEIKGLRNQLELALGTS